MASKNAHIGNKPSVGIEFPCPVCGDGTRAKGSFRKSEAGADGIVSVNCDCPNGHSFSGTGIVTQPAALDVDVTIDDSRLRDEELHVYGNAKGDCHPAPGAARKASACAGGALRRKDQAGRRG